MNEEITPDEAAKSLTEAIEGDINEEDATLTEGTPPESDIPEGLKELNAEQVKMLKEKLAAFTQSKQTTISGSEAPEDATPTQGPVMSGKDVDWSEYDLDFSVRHLYPHAHFRETPQGPKWVAMIDEFYSTERDFGNKGKMIKKGSESLNLGEYLNDMLNSAEGWKLVSVLPTGMGKAGILFQRQVPVVLPDPRQLEKETEVEPPGDRELDNVDEAAEAFMQSEGLSVAKEAGAQAAAALAEEDFGDDPVNPEE